MKLLWKICFVVAFTAAVWSLIPVTMFADSANKDGTQSTITPDPTVYLKGHQLKATKVPSLAKNTSTYTVTNEDTGPFIVMLTGPIDESVKTQITEAGATLIEYLPDFAYLVTMSPSTAANIAALPFVLDVQEYQPVYKIDPGLTGSDGQIKGTGEITLYISTFDDKVSISDTELANLNAQKLGNYRGGLMIKVDRMRIPQLALLSNVKFIEENSEISLSNDLAKGFIHADNLWNLGYDGDGQVIGISDTGLDTGVNDSTMHLDFQGRIDAIFPLYRPSADDPHGHGTHVAGSVLGNGARSNGQIKGMAPKAHLVFQSILNDAGGLELPADLNDLFQQAWDAGARIHTNSWGNNNPAFFGKYTSQAQQIDEFVWNHDMTILFSAGNQGMSDTTITSPGTAKNVITVGASGNNRPNAYSSNDPLEVSPFSSRGWTEDGRIKPDVVAPGSGILSTRSSLAPDQRYEALDDSNPYYAYMSGTSMATPITAGAVAVARQYMMDNWEFTPKPALLKAAIINGAADLGYGIPSNDQGWGRVNLVDSLQSKEYAFDQESTLTTGGTKTYTYSIAENRTPLRITLVWTDYPAAIAAAKTLVNDLDLTVVGPDGITYYGNDFLYEMEYDHINNVENVWITTPKPGNYTVTIEGFNVPNGPQPFALFASGNFGVPDIANDTTPPTCSLTAPTAGVLSGTVTVRADAADNIDISKVEFYANATLIGSAARSPFSIEWDTTKFENGSYAISAKAYDLATNATISDSVSVTLDNRYDCTVTEHFAGKVNYYGTANANYYIHVTDPGPVQVNVSWPTKADLDVSIINPNGTETARANSIHQPETLTYNAVNSGLYTIHVTAFAGADAFAVTATHDINSMLTNQFESVGSVDTAGNRYVEYPIIINSASGSINIEVSWNDSADLDIYLYDPSGKLVAKSFSGRHPETISYVIPANGAGIYRVKVDAYSGNTTYSIHIFSPK